ncbi:hypothetical protein ARMSODRAFT_1016758 [Armillaria solidipes]|uniref:Uncharacterized protein n=1 Tax=Armillaria solidipes TaxID=1076256 RepID=A0A2H3C902_9AGAR|nr:hypothetical protein ARMSODRAFT_1016758 [Armillaria solidipes]
MFLVYLAAPRALDSDHLTPTSHISLHGDDKHNIPPASTPTTGAIPLSYPASPASTLGPITHAWQICILRQPWTHQKIEDRMPSASTGKE